MLTHTNKKIEQTLRFQGQEIAKEKKKNNNQANVFFPSVILFVNRM